MKAIAPWLMLAMMGGVRFPALKEPREQTQADLDRLAAAQAKRDRKAAKRSKRK